MAILGMISGDVTLSGDLTTISVPVVFFDDADPDNVGYVQGHLPRTVLFHWTFPYAVTLQGAQLQAQVAADIKAKGQAYEAATSAFVAANGLLPQGALVPVDG
jgi:hypothetical protein